MSTISIFHPYSSSSYRYTKIYDSNSPYKRYNIVNNSVMMILSTVVINAILTQEVNSGGTLSLSIEKPNSYNNYATIASANLKNMLSYYDRYIEVVSPYIADGDTTKDRSFITKWRGMRTSTTELHDRFNLIFDGELSYLSRVVKEPYETSSMIASGFVNNMLTHYNNAIPANYPRVVYSYRNADEGPSVVRSNSSISTVWDEINEKILKKYNNQLSVCDSSAGEYRRLVFLRGLPTTASDRIIGSDILSVSHTVNGAERNRTVFIYGAQTSEAEGDLNRIKGSYKNYATGYEQYVNPITETHKIYDEITTTSTLDTKAQELYDRSILDSDGIELTLTPEKGEGLVLGNLYSIFCPRAGISGNYRLIKRVIDILNPSKNKYTFGTAQKFITR